MVNQECKSQPKKVKKVKRAKTPTLRRSTGGDGGECLVSQKWREMGEGGVRKSKEQIVVGMDSMWRDMVDDVRSR